jgi:type III pantothenate kinase
VLTDSDSADRDDSDRVGLGSREETHRQPRRILVDIGNSGLKIAWMGPGRELQQVRRLPWRFEAAAEEAGKAVGGSLSVDGPKLDRWLQDWRAAGSGEAMGQEARSNDAARAASLGQEPAAAWWVSSVNPLAGQLLADVLVRRWGGEQVLWLSIDQVPMRFDLEPNSGLGVDRLLAAWGAYCRLQPDSPLVVVQAGTALTVDWVSREGVFGGGAILPGAAMTLRWLARGTARLPAQNIPDDWNHLPIPGRNTAQAMAAGCVAGLCGGLNWLVERYRQNESTPVPVVISGGDADRLLPHVPPPVCSQPDLVLHGLAACAEPACRPASVD